MKQFALSSIALTTAAGMAVAAAAQAYPQARPYPGVGTPVMRAPATGNVRAPAQVRADTVQRQSETRVSSFDGPAAMASNWEIGPIIRGKSRSEGMPLRPTQLGQGTPGAWAFEFPGPTERAGHVNYVTMPVGSLADARRITMTYRIDAGRGVQFHPQEYPGTPATMSLYFQVRGDNWTARDQYRFARWYAPWDKVMRLAPGIHTVSIDMDENWAAVVAFKRDTAPEEFRRALANASRVGFTFGGKGGRGHGVYATGAARFTLLDFRLE